MIHNLNALVFLIEKYYYCLFFHLSAADLLQPLCSNFLSMHMHSNTGGCTLLLRVGFLTTADHTCAVNVGIAADNAVTQLGDRNSELSPYSRKYP